MSSNEHPDMSGSGCDDEGFVEDDMERAFRAGAQQMREMLARLAQQDGYDSLALSMRLNWVPNWGKDPGKADDVYSDMWRAI